MNNMYLNSFVVCVIANGKIQKESTTGTCSIPFGSEYTIRLRNKNSRRAVCVLSIDGKNVSEDGFVIEAKSFIDIERPADSSARFKLVELDSEEAHDQGLNAHQARPHHGLIQANFSLEKEYEPVKVVHVPYPVPYPPISWEIQYGGPLNDNIRGPLKSHVLRGNPMTRSSSVNNVTTGTTNSAYNLSGDLSFTKTSVNTSAGVTVEGSQSNQRFREVHFESDGVWTLISLRLLGYSNAGQCLHINWDSMNKTKTCGDLPNSIELLDSVEKIKQLEVEIERLKRITQLEAELESLKKQLA